MYDGDVMPHPMGPNGPRPRECETGGSANTSPIPVKGVTSADRPPMPSDASNLKMDPKTGPPYGSGRSGTADGIPTSPTTVTPPRANKK